MFARRVRLPRLRRKEVNQMDMLIAIAAVATILSGLVVVGRAVRRSWRLRQKRKKR
jgi:hypothetical protein